jgi:signal peptidase
MSRALRWLVTLVVLMLVAPFVVYAVPQTVGADHGFVVLSGSMEPKIATGDVVIVEDVPSRTVAVGDVITYTRAGQSQPTTHRVVDVYREDGSWWYVTKGDANEDLDPQPVRASSLVGRVAFTIPVVGHVITFVGTTDGFLLLVALPFVLLVLGEVWSLVRGIGGSPGSGDGTDNDADGEDDGSGGGAEPASATAAVDAPEDAIVITRADMTMALPVLGVLAVYACYVALQTIATGTNETFASVSVALTVASFAGFLLLAGLWLVGGSAPATAGDSRAAVTVGEPMDVGAFAAAGEGVGVLADRDMERFVLVDDGVVYVAPVDERPTLPTLADPADFAPVLRPGDDPAPAVRPFERPAPTVASGRDPRPAVTPLARPLTDGSGDAFEFDHDLDAPGDAETATEVER